MTCDAKGAQAQYTGLTLTINDSESNSVIADEIEISSASYQTYLTTIAVPATGAVGVVTFYSEDSGVFDNYTVVEE